MEMVEEVKNAKCTATDVSGNQVNQVSSCPVGYKG